MPSNRRGVSELPYLCQSFGIEHAVISPGSRNAPLTIAFTTHPAIHCHSITDERSAGYFGLGMAQQLRQPVVLICTSGTALVNYGPALAEAFYLRIPLIAISADRPQEWIDQNDGQTIRQYNLFSNLVKKSCEVPVETEKEEDLWLFRRKISDAINTAKNELPGPVHINVPIREPLYEAMPEIFDKPAIIQTTKTVSQMKPEHGERLTEKLKEFPKILIIFGMQLPNAELSKEVNKITKKQNAVVIAENLANIHCSDCIDTPDRFVASLSTEQKPEFQPDLLITTGGPIVSKQLKKFLRIYKPREHWHIGEQQPIIDTFQALTQNININPVDFFSHLAENSLENEHYAQSIKLMADEANELHEKILREAPYSDLAVYDLVLQKLPEECNLHLANSTPVRYSQLFATKKEINYYSNRGTSGIDGCISTAAGAASVSSRINIAMVGDLAFIYDSNGLWNNNLPENLKIIVIDNDGGNIFKLIETSPVINPIRSFFETPHNVKIDKLCEAFGIEYHYASNLGDISQKTEVFFQPTGKPGVLHIKTSGDISAKVFKQYYQYIFPKK
jgi:2-succinyl-5-enolpyruvyl-6-hydroxy-3-cyclohexene-1-carboxylate synthase